MGRFVEWVRALAMALGVPGLFLVAFLDSSILSLPEIADLLVIWMVTRHKSRVILYALSATAGSIVGCLLLYYLGKKGGEAFIRRRFSNTAMERSLEAFRRYGVMAILIPSLLPPPAPFKVFVLIAGIANISAARFTTAVAIGRGARYFIEGFLAVRYGEAAITFMHAHAASVSLALAALLLGGLIWWIAWTKAQARNGR